MKLPVALAAALVVVSMHQAGIAQEPADAAASLQVEKKDRIYDSEGKIVGRVYNIREEKDGTRTVQVIFHSMLVNIPENTLTATDKGFASSYTRAELSRRR